MGWLGRGEGGRLLQFSKQLGKGHHQLLHLHSMLSLHSTEAQVRSGCSA